MRCYNKVSLIMRAINYRVGNLPVVDPSGGVYVSVQFNSLLSKN